MTLDEWYARSPARTTIAKKLDWESAEELAEWLKEYKDRVGLDFLVRIPLEKFSEHFKTVQIYYDIPEHITPNGSEKIEVKYDVDNVYVHVTLPGEQGRFTRYAIVIGCHPGITCNVEARDLIVLALLELLRENLLDRVIRKVEGKASVESDSNRERLEHTVELLETLKYIVKEYVEPEVGRLLSNYTSQLQTLIDCLKGGFERGECEKIGETLCRKFTKLEARIASVLQTLL